MKTDNKTRITIEFNSEKATAVRMYLRGKGMELERELIKTMENLYDKHVPAQVRDFILLKDQNEVNKVKQDKAVIS